MTVNVNLLVCRYTNTEWKDEQNTSKRLAYGDFGATFYSHVYIDVSVRNFKGPLVLPPLSPVPWSSSLYILYYRADILYRSR